MKNDCLYSYLVLCCPNDCVDSITILNYIKGFSKYLKCSATKNNSCDLRNCNFFCFVSSNLLLLLALKGHIF